MYTNLGKTNNVGELIAVLEKLPNETKVVAMGASCHVMFNAKLKTVVFDYRVDFGNETRIMGGKVLKHYYETEIDHNEYPDFESWLWDMKRCGLVTEV